MIKNKLPTYDDDRIMIRSLELTSKILLIADYLHVVKFKPKISINMLIR